MKNKKLINQGKQCPYCGGSTEYVDSSVVYGRSYGMIYRCSPCEAYVGVHKGTDKALGRLADAELREFKKKAHAAFNPIYESGLINTLYPQSNRSPRKKAYLWLSEQLGIPEDETHIGMMDVDQCRSVIVICNRVHGNNNNQDNGIPVFRYDDVPYPQQIS